jgi:hypothetical protein
MTAWALRWLYVVQMQAHPLPLSQANSSSQLFCVFSCGHMATYLCKYPNGSSHQAQHRNRESPIPLTLLKSVRIP